jgi:thermopsin
MFSRSLRWGPLLVVACAIAFLVPTMAAVPLETRTVSLPGHNDSTTQANDLGSSAQARTLATLRADHVPTKDIFLPNANPNVAIQNGSVTPLYTAAPAPMGLGDFGLSNSHGRTVGSISYTDSVKASVTLNSVDPFYLASSSPDIFSMQLNTVLTHTTVQHNTSGQYWIQNVPIYEADSQTLAFEDNIWNFSSPGAGMYPSTLYSYDGVVVAPEFYYAVGPSFYMPEPFTVTVYNNATIFNHRPTVFFNYSITAVNGAVYSGSYDQVEFNATVSAHRPAAPATFQINGKQFNPIGLLNDAEIMLGGPGGGSTTTLFGINATMQLWTLPNGTATYAPVPAGFDFGTDTGETSEGIAEYASGSLANPVAVLNAGPSILQPLWGLPDTHFGYQTDTVTVSPANAFAFVNRGTDFRPNYTAWAPTSPTGTISTQLPPGTYNWYLLLSDHQPLHIVMHGNASISLTLPTDRARGVYTPLWAWNDAELAGISSGGTGTVTNPYILENQSSGRLNPLFGQFNDYVFPEFVGIFLANTNVHVDVVGAPAFEVSYTLAQEAAGIALFGLPTTNELGMQFYNATHVAVVHNSITGWFFADAGSYMANVEFWNSSHNLVAWNDFDVQSTGIILFGGSGNWLSQNWFSAAGNTETSPGAVYGNASQLAIEEYDSGDLIWNNVVLTPYTAWTPEFNLYTGAFQVSVDRWNVSLQSASNAREYDGFWLSGSPIGLTWQGGNYWWNYGTNEDPYGLLPYNDMGLITVGGDWHPLHFGTLYFVTFKEKGLASGQTWSVTFGGITETSTGSTIVFGDYNGSYNYSVIAYNGQTAHPSSGTATISGSNLRVHVKFS